MSNTKGIAELITKLNSLGVNVTDVLEKSIAKNVKLVQAEAKTLCPVDLGDLRNSISTKVEKSSTGVKGVIFTNSDHAAYQEFGTGQRGSESPSPPKSDADLSYREDWTGIKAQPFLYPALKNNEYKVRDKVRKDLQKAIKEVARK